MNIWRKLVGSKTVILGTVVAGVSIVETISPFIPPTYAAPLAAVAGVATILVRFFTNAPLIDRRSESRNVPPTTETG